MTRLPRPVVPLVLAAGLATARSSTATHTLRLDHAPDTDAVFGVWVAAINADCSDTVIGDLGANVVRLSRHPEYRIRTTCAAPPAGRQVEIRGHGTDSSMVAVSSTAYSGGGGFAFLVDDPRVHIHDFAIRGNAYDFPRAIGDGNSGEAIRFEGADGGDGEADHLFIAMFATAGIDVLRAPAVRVHDVRVVCPRSTAPGYSVPGMGIWVREIQRQPPGGAHNGIVEGNTVSDCSAEGITIANATHIAVRNNRVSCGTGACLPTSIGIALYSNDRDCARLPVSSNEVRGNTVVANQSISAGITITGGGALFGSGHRNVIDSNTVTDPVKYGVAVQAAACLGDGYSAYSQNTISRNIISGTTRPLIVNGGAGDTIMLNALVPGGGARGNLIQDLSGAAIIARNVIR